MLAFFATTHILTTMNGAHEGDGVEEIKIPVYKLFGEISLWPTPEPVHYETIAARSALHDWEISSHSHDTLMHVLFLKSGTADMTFETGRFALEVPCVLFVPPRRIHGFHFSPNIDGHIVTFPQNLLGDLFPLSGELHAAFDGLCRVSLGGSPDELGMMDVYFRQFGVEYGGTEAGRLSVLMACLGLILVQLARAGGVAAEPVPHERARARMERFARLVEKHFREWRPIGFYAERLGVSTTQLNNTCRRETGSSAQRFIHERLLLEARRLLAYSGLDVTGIGYALGFRDPAYFTRFFSRTQGLPPSAFRRAHLDRQAAVETG